MAFGSGFLQGLQVGQQYRHNQELMDQRREDRAREQYGRDLENLINDWQNTKGDRTDDEFIKTPEFASLAKRHRGSKVFEKFIQQGNKPGRNTKLRDIVQDPESGKFALVVDTYDDEGRLISKGRPVTEGRESREENPNAKIATFTYEDMYEGMLGAIQQSPDYVDQRGRADRFAAGVEALDPTKQAQGLAAPGSTAPAAQGAPAAPAAPAAAPGPAQATPVQDEELEPSEPLPSPEEQQAQREGQIMQLEGRHNVLRAELDELEEIDNRSSSQMTREQYIKHRRALKKKSEELGLVQEELDELTGGSTARRMGASLSEVPGDFVAGVQEFGEAIADIPAVKGVTEVVSDFFGGLKSGEGIPPPEGTKSSERFEHGSESQANAARKDKKGPLDPSNIKDRTRAQQNKIEQVSQNTALAVANNKKLTRKMLSDYRKALRAQVLHGDISVKDATASYYAVLKASKSTGKYKLHLDSENGVAFLLNEDDGSVTRSQYAAGAGGAGSTKFEKDEYKRMETMADIMSRGDENAKADIMALVDQSRDSMGIIQQQPGWHAVAQGAYDMWKNVVASETSYIEFLGTSKGEAKAKWPSISPFLSARTLGIPNDDNLEQTMNDFGGRLAMANGGTALTEAQWLEVTKHAQLLAQEGIVGNAALELIASYYEGK